MSDQLPAEAQSKSRELELREREVVAKEIEQATKIREIIIKEKEAKYQRWTNPLFVSLLAATLAAGANIYLSYYNSGQQREADTRKSDAERMLEVIKTSDQVKRCDLLALLVEFGLIKDEGIKTKASIQVSRCKSPPSANSAAPSSQLTANAVNRNFDLPITPALDGTGNVVGSVGPIHIHVFQERSEGKLTQSKYTVSYGFYNGSGTWRGQQSIVLVFRFESGATQQISIPLDRSRCSYGGPASYSQEGNLDVSNGLVQRVDMTITRVQGAQSGC